MEINVKRFLSLALCMTAVHALADLNVAVENVEENFSEIVKASGIFHMGLQFSGKHDFANLYVGLPEKSKGMLCINMASIDGRYKGKLRYAIDAPVSGWTRVNFDSKYDHKLSGLGVNELALLASLGSDCEAPDRKTLVAGWSADTSEATPVVIIRSSFRLDEARLPNSSDAREFVKCKKFSGSRIRSFDKYCEIDRASFEESTSIEIRRNNHWGEEPPEMIIISR